MSEFEKPFEESPAEKYEELEKLLLSASEKPYGIKSYNKGIEFIKNLQKEYSNVDLTNYKLYHLLIGSSSKQPTEFDIDGKMEAFIRNLKSELEQTED